MAGEIGSLFGPPGEFGCSSAMFGRKRPALATNGLLDSNPSPLELFYHPQVATQRQPQGAENAGRQAGKVFLIGAGPGDAGLITWRGVECLRQADAVLYDYLVNPAILRHARADCR